MATPYNPDNPAQYQLWENTLNNLSTWMNSNYPAVSKANVKYLDTTNNQSTDLDPAVSDFATLAGTLAGGPVGAAVGNIAGGLFNQYLNAGLQEQQFENQKELQQRAFHLNQAAQTQQASNQVIGLQQAGLNPALANGQGAPSIQAGAAAGATSQLSNVFAGMADIINAIKTNSEIKKMNAETNLINAQASKTDAETDLAKATTTKTEIDTMLSSEQINNVKQQTDLLFENTTSAKNANQVFESYNNFIKTYNATMFDQYMEKLKADGSWDNMSPRTKDTIEAFANGEIELDAGGISALRDFISTQGQMSETDKAMLFNGLESAIIREQLNNPEIKKAMAAVPVNELRDMQESWKTQRSQRLTQAEQRKLIQKQASGQEIENTQRELDDINYLIKKGRYKDAGMQFLRNLGHTVVKVAPVVGGAVVGGMIGGPAGAVAGGAAGAAGSVTTHSF